MKLKIINIISLLMLMLLDLNFREDEEHSFKKQTRVCRLLPEGQFDLAGRPHLIVGFTGLDPHSRQGVSLVTSGLPERAQCGGSELRFTDLKGKKDEENVKY